MVLVAVQPTLAGVFGKEYLPSVPILGHLIKGRAAVRFPRSSHSSPFAGKRLAHFDLLFGKLVLHRREAHCATDGSRGGAPAPPPSVEEGMGISTM